MTCVVRDPSPACRGLSTYTQACLELGISFGELEVVKATAVSMPGWGLGACGGGAGVLLHLSIDCGPAWTWMMLGTGLTSGKPAHSRA